MTITQSTALTGQAYVVLAARPTDAGAGPAARNRGPMASTAARRHRRRTHLLPLIAVAAIAFVVGLLAGRPAGSAERRVATEYVRAWAREDYPAMYALLDPVSQRGLTEPAFAAAYLAAARTATLVALVPGRVGRLQGGAVAVAVVARTRLFGDLRETLAVPFASGERVRFMTRLVFPGLRAGERLSRRVQMPPRASLLAADGTPLAQGPQRTSPIPDVAGAIAGVLGPIPSAQAAAFAAQGYPPNARVGLDGLERI